jgi:uncharacterized glyoxalase superfamily protein PhnB
MVDVHAVYPYLRVHNSAQAISFYEKAFGATELFRLTEPSGRIGHAEIKVGPATLMLSDEYPESGIRGPLALGGTTFSMHLHVDDADQAFERAVQAGASGTGGCHRGEAAAKCILWRTRRHRSGPVRS